DENCQDAESTFCLRRAAPDGQHPTSRELRFVRLQSDSSASLKFLPCEPRLTAQRSAAPCSGVGCDAIFGRSVAVAIFVIKNAVISCKAWALIGSEGSV